MRRILATVIVGVVLTAVLVVLVAGSQNDPESVSLNTPLPTVNIPTSLIVVAITDLPRGTEVTENDVGLIYWPDYSLPEEGNYFVSPHDVVGLIARTDIPRGLPVLRRHLVDDVMHLGSIGSDLALSIGSSYPEEGAVPVRLSSIWNMPDDLAQYDNVAVWGIFDLDTMETIQIINQATVLEISDDAETMTLAVQDYFQMIALVWAEDAGTPLRLIRLSPSSSE